MPIPSSIARFGESTSTGLPSRRTCPSSGCTIPDRMFISVDLPAPFSPSRQCTSPRRTTSEMRSFASTPGNALVIPTSSTAGCSRPASSSVVGLPVIALHDGGGAASDRPACRSLRGSQHLQYFFTAFSVAVTTTLIEPLLILRCAVATLAQAEAGALFVLSSERPLLAPSTKVLPNVPALTSLIARV